MAEDQIVLSIIGSTDPCSLVDFFAGGVLFGSAETVRAIRTATRVRIRELIDQGYHCEAAQVGISANLRREAMQAINSGLRAHELDRGDTVRNRLLGLRDEAQTLPSKPPHI